LTAPVIKNRNHLATELGNLKWRSFLRSQIDRSLPVLFEKRFLRKSGRLIGLSDNYIRVECAGGKEYFNRLVSVTPMEIIDRRILGRINGQQ